MLDKHFEEIEKRLLEIQNYYEETKIKLKEINQIHDNILFKIKESNLNVVQAYKTILELKKIRQIRRLAKNEIKKIESINAEVLLKNVKQSKANLERVEEYQSNYHDNWIVSIDEFYQLFDKRKD